MTYNNQVKSSLNKSPIETSNPPNGYRGILGPGFAKSFLAIMCLFVTFALICSLLVIDRNYEEEETYIFDLGISGPSSMNLLYEYHYKPEQIHLSLGSNDSKLWITWSTKKAARTSTVRVFVMSEDGRFDIFTQVEPVMRQWVSTETDPKHIHATGFIHKQHFTYRAEITGLDTSKHTRYYYQIESTPPEFVFDGIRSRVYDFRGRNFADFNKSLNFIFYGDLGIVNAQSLPRLISYVDSMMFDIIVHNGDFAYDLDKHHGKYGDDFMNMIEPIAARIPYQTSVGNHEVAQKFDHYNERFTMMNNSGLMNNFHYSYNAGPIHFIAFSTEYYYFLEYMGLKYLVDQYEWIKQDLEQANQPEERAKRPWIVVYAHRPMYCSSRDNDDCSKETNILRKGLPVLGFGLEKLFYDYGVDLELYSHEHQYERFLPLYDGKVLNGTSKPNDPYHDPRAPVHIISGSAGCSERLDPFRNSSNPASVVQISDYGFTTIMAQRCQMTIKQISDDQDGDVVDEIVITKTRQNFPKLGQLCH